MLLCMPLTNKVSSSSGRQHNHSAARPYKVQPASRSPCAVGLRYGVVPVRKRKKSAIKLLEIDIPGHDEVLGQPDASHAQLKATADSFYLPLWTEKLYGNE